jgi:curved DNA-binding protein CbpA
MGYHSFSMDPRTVLGVGPDASLDEIRDAYHAKSKKHHPDMGGDEWAFRMVTRAYEVLKTTTDALSGPRPWESPGAEVPPQGQSPGWTWGGSGPFGGFGAASPPPSGFAEPAEGPAETYEEGQSHSTPTEAEAPIADPAKLRTVEVELIWTRFEFELKKDGPRPFLSSQDEDDATLSVCMVVSWPPPDLVEDAAKFSSSGEILRTLIDRFEWVRGQKSVVAARSRIEDGRFVGWLSYPDVLTAQDAFLILRETFGKRGLTVKLQTRDERVPFDWHRTFRPTVMSQAS